MNKLWLLFFVLYGITILSGCSKSHTKFTVLGFELDIEDKEDKEEFIG
jgi:hypothetical protein